MLRVCAGAGVRCGLPARDPSHPIACQGPGGVFERRARRGEEVSPNDDQARLGRGTGREGGGGAQAHLVGAKEHFMGESAQTVGFTGFKVSRRLGCRAGTQTLGPMQRARLVTPHNDSSQSDQAGQVSAAALEFHRRSLEGRPGAVVGPAWLWGRGAGQRGPPGGPLTRVTNSNHCWLSISCLLLTFRGPLIHSGLNGSVFVCCVLGFGWGRVVDCGCAPTRPPYICVCACWVFSQFFFLISCVFKGGTSALGA